MFAVKFRYAFGFGWLSNEMDNKIKRKIIST